MAVQRRVLIMVFDGLQPAQITPELMPNLSKFANGGVTFANHHPVFPTVTRVNASSLVTGCMPGRHGLAGNTFLCRDFDPHRVIPAMEPTLQEVVDTTGHALLVPDTGRSVGPARHGILRHRHRDQRQRLHAQPQCGDLRRRDHSSRFRVTAPAVR